VLYEILTRSNPYKSLDAVNTALQVVNNTIALSLPTDTTQKFPEISKLFQSCFFRDPLLRPSFADISDMLQDIS